MNTSLLSTILVLWGVTNYISSNKIEHYDPPSVQKSRSTSGYASASYSNPNLVERYNNTTSQPNMNEYKNVIERFTTPPNSNLSVVANRVSQVPSGPMNSVQMDQFDQAVVQDMVNMGSSPIPAGGQDRTQYYKDMVTLLNNLLTYFQDNKKEWTPPFPSLAPGQTRSPAGEAAAAAAAARATATLTPTQQQQVIMKYQGLINYYTQLSLGPTAAPVDLGRISTTGTAPVPEIDNMFNIADSNWRNDEVLNAAHDSYYKMMTGSMNQMCGGTGQRVSTMTRTNLLSLYGDGGDIPDHIRYWKQDGVLTYVWRNQDDLKAYEQGAGNIQNRLGLDKDAAAYLIGIGDIVRGGRGNQQLIFNKNSSVNEGYHRSNLSH